MLYQENEYLPMDDVDVTAYIKELEGNDISDTFEDFKLSDSVLNNDSTELSVLLDEYSKTHNDNSPPYTPQSSVLPMDAIAHVPDIQMDEIVIGNDEQFIEDDLDQNLDHNQYEETIVPQENQQDMSQTQEQMNVKIDKDPFDLISNNMVVKEQPKPDQRARYESDGPRFLPDSKKHPMSIQLPDLSSKLLSDNEVYGVILTMVTSTFNPRNTTFVHVNGIKYRTDDVIDIGHGSIFLPITKSERQKSEKIFPRLSIICKKFDEYTFDLTTFDPANTARITDKYTLINEATITKAAKGKQFTTDYDLLCYKIIFQLAFKQGNTFLISHIKCETDLINEQKTPAKGVKREASSNDKISNKRKGSIDMPILKSPKKSKSSVLPFTERPVLRTSNRKIKRSQGSSVDSC